ncbi:hypothetical protein [Halosolutus halophilus]|uniref:hypothetical protein n=1 Tax=Halosolutus halophilus TaxID=1552990 RepID=UPI0022352E32|nr:hypothetical protein [Halosolutus halophilus]
MPPSEPGGQRGRLVGALLAVCLTGFLLWAGTLPASDETLNAYPDEDQVGPAPEAYVGESVVLSGTVVATEPVVIETRYHDVSRQFTLDHAATAVRNTNDPIEVGDRITAFGTLAEPSTLATERAIARAPWEFQYMYLVSFLGGCLALGSFLRHWRFDRARLAFVPRETPLALRGRQGSSRDDTTPTESEPDAPTEEPPSRPASKRGEQ